METIFIIGGSGFIGKNLVDYFYNDYNIHIFDKFIDEDFFSTKSKVKTTMMDLADEKIPEDIKDPDYIINLASIVTAERDLSLFDELISSNLKVLLNLFDRFKDSTTLKLFIQFGSIEEYGSDGSPFVETQREKPNSPYALVKQLTTNTAIMLHNNYGFPSTVVRPGNLFGPGQNSSKFIPYVISQLRQNSPLNVTPCEQKRDFMYVKDFAQCIGEIIKNYSLAVGEIVNVSTGDSISLKEIIENVKQAFESTSVVNFGAKPYRENEAMDLCCDISKMERIIGKKVKFDTLININSLLNN